MPRETPYSLEEAKGIVGDQRFPLDTYPREVMAWLIAEVERLQRGGFTAEEMQAFCHHRDLLPGCTRENFEAGCRAYSQQLFGSPDVVAR